MAKEKLTKKEEEWELRNVRSTLGDLAQEGFVDDNDFLKNLLTDLALGKITEEEYDKAVKEKIGIK